jgi:hypothetical protein
MRPLHLVLAAALCACGANSAEIQKSKSVAYNAEFATVWKAAFGEVAARYDGQMLKATPEDGWIMSTWKLVEATRENSVGTARTPAEKVLTGGGTFFRHVVRITGVSGGPPWRVEVDGEAAQYSPGYAILTPFPHGAPDEPGWVPGRIDDLGTAIYKRLQQYAVAAPPLESGTALNALGPGNLLPGATPKSNVPNTPATTVVHPNGASLTK